MKAVKTGWDFFRDQILGMRWLKDLVGKLLAKAGLGEGRFPGEFLHFFLYDIIKIFVLLAVLIFLISYIQSYFPPERSRKIMGKFHGIWANLIGALLGTVTPFCSCSSIPIFMGFTSAGLPLGVTFSFLISSPMVDLGSLVLLMSVFGGKIAFAYVIVGLVIAVTGGTIIERLHMEDQVADFIRQAPNVEVESPSLTVADRMDYAKNQVVSTVKKVAPYIVAGVIIGAAIHNLIPGHIVRSILGKPDLVCSATGNSSRCSDVCRHFRNHPGCRKPAGKRCRTWNDSFVYDGSDNPFTSIYGNAVKSDQEKTARNIHWDCLYRNNHCGVWGKCDNIGEQIQKTFMLA